MNLTEYLQSLDRLKRDRLKRESRPVATGPFETLESYVLKHGRPFASMQMSTEEEAFVFQAVERFGGPRRLKIKQCFYNSQMVLLSTPPEEGMTLRYVEGFMSRGDLPMPIMHGWLSLNGKVVDLTLRNRLTNGKRMRSRVRRGQYLGDRVAPMGFFHAPVDYFGAMFSTPDVRRRVMETQEGGSMLDDWKRKWPYLRGLEKAS